MSRSEGAQGSRMDSRTRVVTRTLTRPRSAASILHAASRTTQRDLSLFLDLYDHRVLTTPQVFELHFNTLRRAQKRLFVLQQQGMVDRFRPIRFNGSHPWHYILGEIGAQVVASWRGVEARELAFRMDRQRRIAHSPRLAHLVEVNGFFCRVAYRCRNTELRLSEWWSERRCAAAWEGMVRTDGLGRVQGPGVDVRFFFELDRGTEHSSRLEEKLTRYTGVAGAFDAPEAVIFVFPTERRETEARRALFNCGMLVLTATRHSAMADPLGPICLPVGADVRVRIADITSPRTGQ
jgi:Replication-relaxation